MHTSASRIKLWLINSAIFLLIIAPVLLLAVFSYTQTKQDLTNSLLSERGLIVSNATTKVEERFERLLAIGTSYSTLVQFRKYVSAGQWDEAMNMTQSVTNEFPYIETVMLTDIYGNVRETSTADKSVVEKSHAYRDWYKGVRNKWEPYISEVYQEGNNPQSHVIALAVPIEADDAVLATLDSKSSGIGIHAAGILVLQIKLDAFLNWTKESKVGNDGSLYIVDKSGHIAAHPKLNLQGRIIDFSKVSAVQKSLAGKSGVEVLYNPLEEKEQLTAYQQVPFYGWGVIATQDAKSAFAERDAYLQSLLILSALLLLLNIIVAFFILYTLPLLKKRMKAK